MTRTSMPSVGEHAVCLAALSAYGQHARRLPPKEAFDLALRVHKDHVKDNWRSDVGLIRMLETYDRLSYEKRRKAS